MKKPTRQSKSPTQPPSIDRMARESEKAEGPQHAAFSKEEIHAASLLHAPPGDGSAPERARRMAALQHRMGNARLDRLLGEAGVPETGGVPKTGRVEAEEIPKRE
jgi:hypothetical protein